MNKPRHPFLAAGLSFTLPGLGQCYAGEYGYGAVLLCMDAGIFLSLVLSRSPLTVLFMGIAYLLIAVPASRDAYRLALDRPRGGMSGSIPYVIAMLLILGPFALPLLWRSSKFSRGSKIFWTFFVSFIAVLFIVTMAFLGPLLERVLQGRI